MKKDGNRLSRCIMYYRPAFAEALADKAYHTASSEASAKEEGTKQKLKLVSSDLC
jgi:hypothetical protein